MNLSKEVAQALNDALAYARDNKYEYITPEILLLFMIEDETFSEAFYYCGGDANLLASRLEEYIKEYVEKVEGKDPEMSVGMNYLFTFAGQSAYSSGSEEIHIRHLVHAIWNLDNSYAR